MSPIAIGIFGLVGAVLLIFLVFLVRDVVTRSSGSGVILIGGLFVLFVGERVFGEGDWRLPVSGLGLLVILGAIGLRAFAFVNSTDARKQGHRLALAWSLVVLGSLTLYAFTLAPLTTPLGLDEDGLARWNGAWK